MSRRLLALFAVPALCLLALTPDRAAAQATYTVIGEFDGATAGGPTSGLVEAPDGSFYGTTFLGTTNMSGEVYKIGEAGGISPVYVICSNGASTCSKPGTLTVGSDGNFYGVSNTGGTSGAYGSVFKLTPSGTLTVLHNFTDGTDGSYPSGPLLQATDGNYYGTASQGGLANGCNNGFSANGCGLIFKITPSGTFSVFYTFQGGADGGGPTSGVIQGSDGNFYGFTAASLFKVTPGGVATTVASSNFQSEGAYLNGPPAEGLNGLFYGSASESGSDGYGTTFAASSSGFTLLHTFTGSTDGGAPLTPLVIGTDGNFYGTTSQGGDPNCAQGFGCGTIFQMTPAGTINTLYTFSASANGVLPGGTPIQGDDAAFFGTATNGGECNECGTVYKLAVTGVTTPPVQLSFNPTSIALGSTAVLTYKSNYAIEDTQQVCNAFTSSSAAGTWSGKQAGTYSSSTHAWSGTANIKPTAAGTYTYSLNCAGTYSGFATLTVTSGGGKTNSTTTLAATPSSPSVGQSVALKATVTGSSGTPTGSVSFKVGTTVLDTANLSSGSVTFTASTNGLAPGTYPLTASYAGNSSYNASNLATDNVVLELAPTTTTLSINPTSVTPPASATFTATVKRSASGAAGTPTGSVSFYTGTTFISKVNLNTSGVATFTASSNGIAAGTYPITARYSGDASDVPSNSAAENVTVK